MNPGFRLLWRKIWANTLLCDPGKKFLHLESCLHLTNVLGAGMYEVAAGLPEGSIRAQTDHISAKVIKRYSHIRRQELNRAATLMEPKFLKNVLVI